MILQSAAVVGRAVIAAAFGKHIRVNGTLNQAIHLADFRSFIRHHVEHFVRHRVALFVCVGNAL